MSRLTQEHRAALLRSARIALNRHFVGDVSARDPLPATPDIPNHGVFVTLRKAGRLRGCVGTFRPDGSLAESICTMAIAAAHDGRFRDAPLSATELPALQIELSILSPLERLGDPLEFELGVHGIYVRRGYFTGCFLPDVAVERGWSREEFLSACCQQKAALPADAWQDPETEVHVFTVEKICDEFFVA